MRIVLAAAVLLGGALPIAPSASAQLGDPPAICTSSTTIWNSVSGGTDVAAMHAVRAQTPGACRVLLARIDARIAAVSRPAASAPAAPVNSCVQARSDWASVQNSTSLNELQTYRSSVPASCALWRVRADERMAALRQQQQEQAAAAARITAARAIGIEGAWTSLPSRNCSTGIYDRWEVTAIGIRQTYVRANRVTNWYVMSVTGNRIVLANNPNNPSAGSVFTYEMSGGQLFFRGPPGNDVAYYRCP